MKMTQKHLFMYRVQGRKPDGKLKVHVKCSKEQAEAMARSWGRGRPDVVTMTGEKVDLPPLQDVEVIRSYRVIWPHEVPHLKADLLTRLADYLEDTLDWDEHHSDPDYLLGYREAINKIVAVAEDERKKATNDPESET